MDKGEITLESPIEDYWAGYTAILEAFGVKDKGPVPDQITAAKVAAIALRRYRDSVRQGAGNGKNTGSGRKKSGTRPL